jgi:DNA-binding response OmpR family regulator
MKVLVLEDDVLLAMDVEDHLTEQGVRVVGPFGRVPQALEAVNSVDLDGAILDLNLNGELSFPVIEALKSKGVPLIVCSGYAELPELKSKLAGLPLLAKPWNPQKLAKLMDEHFSADPEQPAHKGVKSPPSIGG